MKSSELKQKYLDFFVKKNHRIIPNVSLVPENDPSTLFISAGMHPLVPYLLGEIHPLGKRVCSLQRCLRTDDIDNVGDGFHHTFFEMLGNWSLGDYWKEEALSWSLEFLTEVLGFDQKKLSVSCFAGDKDAPKDEESAKIWLKLGIPKERIYFLPKKDNWWGPVGGTGPCGSDSEMFIDTGKPKCSSGCGVSCQCGKYIEVWNDVFMQYNKTAEGKFIPLKQKNVDTGMGVERVTALTSGFGEDDYQTELFWPIIQEIEQVSDRKYENSQKPMRIMADHLRAAAFLIADGVIPENKDRSYVLRRLIRRAVFQMSFFPRITSPTEATKKISQKIIEIYGDSYPIFSEPEKVIVTLTEEIKKFEKTLSKGIKFLNKYLHLDAQIAFDAFQTYGVPFDVAKEIAAQKGQKVNQKDFEKKFNQHQQLSRKGARKKFAGGLADHSQIVIKYHTATHLLHAALRKILGEHVHQVGSNLTAERLRFDFTHPNKLTDKQIRKIEELINKKIKENLPVKMEIMSLAEAQKKGALAFFSQKYGEKVNMYMIGDFSKEVCGGPHVKATGEIGQLEIFKEETSGVGKRRLYARLK
jgi:alanyl-tRNA synthetase